MPFAIFALAAVNIAIGTQGFVFAGLLTELAADLGVTLGTAGLLVTASAVTFAIGSPFAAMLVSQIERRRVLVIGLVILAAINVACAYVPSFGALMGLRVAAGVCTAFAGSLATVAAASLVPPEQRGRAFAVVVGGLTVAFVLGVPLGSVIGGAYGWRSAFLFAAGISAASALLIRLTVPLVPPVAGTRPELLPLLRNHPLVHTFALSLLGFAAMFSVVSFVGPIITSMTGATGSSLGALQSFIGVGSIVGLAAGGILSDRQATRGGLMGAFAVMAVALAVYWVLLSQPQHTVSPYIVAAHLLVGASTLFAVVPMTMSRLAQIAGPATPVALALNGSLVSLGQGLGAVWGGFIKDAYGFPAMGIAGALLAVTGLLLAAGLTAAQSTQNLATEPAVPRT
jgi:MFS transporter, DHA1 family, inner membrane transport protein